jgi:hypothetical protein
VECGPELIQNWRGLGSATTCNESCQTPDASQPPPPPAAAAHKVSGNPQAPPHPVLLVIERRRIRYLGHLPRHFELSSFAFAAQWQILLPLLTITAVPDGGWRGCRMRRA